MAYWDAAISTSVDGGQPVALHVRTPTSGWAMLVPVRVWARPGPRAHPAGGRGGLHVAPAVSSRHGAVLELQRAAGNRAVAGRLRLPVVQAQRDHPPIKDIAPAGTLDASAWATMHRQARTALAKGDGGTAESLYLRLLADVATVAGVTVLPGFDPKQIHVYRGSATGGLNLSLDRGDEPGHVGWVDAAGTFGVPLDFSKGVPAVQAGLMISPNAFNDEKAMSMRTIRHEMLHVRHRQITLDAVTKWDAAGRRPAFEKWVAKNAKRLRLSDADVALVQKGAHGGQVDTEVLAYVEGFMTEFHLSPPTKAGPSMAFFELLGAVETTKYFTWKQAHAKVKDEALSRLRDYYATLGSAHRQRWKEWVDDGVAKHGADKTGRKEFFAALATFVK